MPAEVRQRDKIGYLTLHFLLVAKNVKKMLSKKKDQTALKEIIGYTYPKLYVGKRWYIGFYAFDPVAGKMRIKTIKINFIEKAADRRRYANELCKRIFRKLDEGWNPWIEAENSRAYHTFTEVCEKYRRFIEKMFADGNYREETYVGYASYPRNMVKWNGSRKVPITYIYQFDRLFVSEFLDYVYIDRENTAQTRDNYLTFLRVFSSYLVQNSYLKERPTEGISILGKRLHRKQRTIIPDGDMIRLHDYLAEKNKYFLLACYILHYCFVRPKEMSKIQISNFSIKKQTIFIPDSISKNKKNACVTLPKKVILLMLDLGIFNNPGDYYLFSDNFQPGKKYKSEKSFRDFWTRCVRKDLKFPPKYKFYSLKDTGITSMLKKYDTVTVRDQARHADILMTDTYTPHDIQEANELIINHNGIF